MSLSLLSRATKRTFDLICASVGVVATSPVIALAAAMTRAEVGPPGLERLLRAGRDDEPFAMWQLRADERSDFGAWLRATGITMLPALWNVVRGEMSLIGPRPVHPQYAGLAPWRSAVKPGVTGWAQLHTTATRSWDDEQVFDRYYIDHPSLTLDTMILVRSLLDRVRRTRVADPSAADPSKQPSPSPSHSISN
jgi:lipopolysaccharide/colanic/teichoic acid biosynthesis glycosyltransferase